jgi:alkyl sulfatase BDS1-like metallo-beta-lactamase superfamily hydrolase
MAQAMTVTQLFDTVAIRIDGPRAAGARLSIHWDFTDSGERYLMELSNPSVLKTLLSLTDEPDPNFAIITP